MNTCPVCGRDAGDLDSVMDTLQHAQGLMPSVNIVAQCCGKEIKAYRDIQAYYIVDLEGTREPEFIGHN